MIFDQKHKDTNFKNVAYIMLVNFFRNVSLGQTQSLFNRVLIL